MVDCETLSMSTTAYSQLIASIATVLDMGFNLEIFGQPRESDIQSHVFNWKTFCPFGYKLSFKVQKNFDSMIHGYIYWLDSGNIEVPTQFFLLVFCGFFLKPYSTIAEACFMKCIVFLLFACQTLPFIKFLLLYNVSVWYIVQLTVVFFLCYVACL